jgi:hypothetical protein
MESGPAETLLHLLADAELRYALVRAHGEPPRVEGARGGNGGRPAGWAQLTGAAEVAASLGGDLPAGEVTRLAASTLTVVGVIDHASAAAVVGDLDAALAARGFTPGGSGSGPWAPGWPLLTPEPALPQVPGQPAAGPVRVVPLTARLPVGVAGQRAYLELLACAVAPAGALFAGSARIPQPGRDQELPPLHVDAVDDRGRRYMLTFEGLTIGDALSEGWLSPPPQGEAPRWLEVATGTGRAPVRVDLDAPAVPSGAQVEPVAARSKGELLAEAAAADLLAAALMPVPWRGAVAAVTAEAPGIGSVIAMLLALGLLPADSPALRRLAALGERLGTGFPVQASGLAQPAAGLPESWEAVLADRGRRDGPRAVTRIAAALPELDGARIALTALESAPDRALLHMLTVGWDPPTFGLRAFTGMGEPPLSWWAQDSAGRWHTASGGSWGRHGDREWTGVLQLRPPLHPAATSELTITGTSERLRIMLPLHWRPEGRAQHSGLCGRIFGMLAAIGICRWRP